MPVQSDEIVVLNKLLQGVYLGMDSYTKCINHIKDPELRHRLEQQEKVQRNFAVEIASRIRDIGGRPKENSGIMGIMADTMTNIQLMGKESNYEILNMLIKGLKMGIQGYKEAIPKLDKKSRNLIVKQLQTQEEIYNELRYLKKELPS